ncbi:MAG: RNA polymerase-binding protein DksA [Nitrospirae bacterium]|nr:RNA polymerase-binding protein DksA [Nitrospirota bacterium]
MKKAASEKKKLTERELLILEIRKNLVDQKSKLMAEAEATLNDLPDEVNYPDLGDQASAESDRNFMLKLRSRESKLIKKIDETIERIDRNEYGICEDCGEEIDARRLLARPVTTYCIECKQRQEEDEKLR